MSDRPSGQLPKIIVADVVAEKPLSDPARDKKVLAESKWFSSGTFSRENATTTSEWVNIALRCLMACALYFLTVGWLGAVLYVVYLQIKLRGHLSDGVLIALLTTTTLNVIGLLATVAIYLFPKSKEDK